MANNQCDHDKKSILWAVAPGRHVESSPVPSRVLILTGRRVGRKPAESWGCDYSSRSLRENGPVGAGTKGAQFAFGVRFYWSRRRGSRWSV
jgi:hypothetical protein